MISRRNFLKITAASTTLASIGKITEAKAAVNQVLPDMQYCHEPKKEIPVIAQADIVVVGGNTGGVSAAVSAAKAGSSVFLVAQMPYLGDDICGSFLYKREKDEKLSSDLSRKIFLESTYPTPLFVKRLLDNELIDNHVDFLFCSYVTDVLTDETGAPAGVIIANRSGRQAIKCKSIIDTTTTASVAQMAGAKCSAPYTDKIDFLYTVVGNNTVNAPEIKETSSYKIKIQNKEYPVTQYLFEFPLKEYNHKTLSGIEQAVRDKTWDAEQVDSSDLLWHLPPYTVISEKAAPNNISAIEDIPIETFQPKGIKNCWIISPVIEVDRKIAKKISRPIGAITAGEMIGQYVARSTKDIPFPASKPNKQSPIESANYGEVREILRPLRPSRTLGTVNIANNSIPVLGKYDVVVLGGGTVGTPAGITAAKNGAKTLVLDYLHGLGGTATLGLIGRYWDGFRGGYTETIDKGVRAMAPENHPRQRPDWKESWPADWKMEWYRREMRNAGAEIWFGVLGCGALVEKNKIKGVVVCTPFGRGVILSDILIDSTGSADIAIAAGAPFDYTGKKTIAVQGAGFPKQDPQDYYNNTDWAFIDDSDILDITRIHIQAKNKYRNNYDIGKLPQTRERRRIIGEHIVSAYDVLNHRRYSDTISFHKSSFDTHGMIINPYFILSPPMERHTIYEADVPLRSLLPKGLNGILTTGLGASAHRDAMPVIRMQSCLQAQGYAVGYLASCCIKTNKSIRDIDIKKIQQHLVSMGNLPERVLTDKDFKQYDNKTYNEALLTVADNYKGLEILLTDTEKCKKEVSKLMEKSISEKDKVTYASILCILGVGKYAKTLIREIERKEWDTGWHYTGLGQFGMCMSRLDSLIIALGNSKDKTALPVILNLARQLNANDYFSHFRAIAMACEAIGSNKSVDTLYELLQKPGIQNHYIDNYVSARINTLPAPDDVVTRNKALKELHLARALYCCGDKNGLGEAILKRYANSLEGHYARYANEILNS